MNGAREDVMAANPAGRSGLEERLHDRIDG